MALSSRRKNQVAVSTSASHPVDLRHLGLGGAATETIRRREHGSPWGVAQNPRIVLARRSGGIGRLARFFGTGTVSAAFRRRRNLQWGSTLFRRSPGASHGKPVQRR